MCWVVGSEERCKSRWGFFSGPMLFSDMSYAENYPLDAVPGCLFQHLLES
jgi:hypothetical protein